EEIWHKNNKNFISNEIYPVFNSKDISEVDEVGEYLISEVTDDIAEILKVTKIKPKKICIYTSPSWKYIILRKAINLISEKKLDVGIIMKDVMRDSEMKSISKQISQYVSKLPNEVMKLNENDKNRQLVEIKEDDYLKKSKKYLKEVFSCDIEIFSADEKNIHDPANKTRFAIPLRPAIYVE
ncbi:unnamed protein product, partial [marine sediment metagenome]